MALMAFFNAPGMTRRSHWRRSLHSTVLEAQHQWSLRLWCSYSSFFCFFWPLVLNFWSADEKSDFKWSFLLSSCFNSCSCLYFYHCESPCRILWSPVRNLPVVGMGHCGIIRIFLRFQLPLRILNTLSDLCYDLGGNEPPAANQSSSITQTLPERAVTDLKLIQRLLLTLLYRWCQGLLQEAAICLDPHRLPRSELISRKWHITLTHPHTPKVFLGFAGKDLNMVCERARVAMDDAPSSPVVHKVRLFCFFSSQHGIGGSVNAAPSRSIHCMWYGRVGLSPPRQSLLCLFF